MLLSISAFAILESLIFLSAAAGATVAGQLVSSFGRSAPFIATLACGVAALLVVLLFFRDARTARQEAPCASPSAVIQPIEELPTWRQTMADSLSLATCTDIDAANQRVNASPAFVALMFALMYSW